MGWRALYFVVRLVMHLSAIIEGALAEFYFRGENVLWRICGRLEDAGYELDGNGYTFTFIDEFGEA